MNGWTSPPEAYERDYTKPAENITTLDLVFPASGPKFAPPEETIPAEEIDPKWLAFQKQWFFHGVPDDVALIPRDGIDGKRALAHLKIIQGTFGIRHEHKEKAVAYLAGKWFKDLS